MGGMMHPQALQSLMQQMQQQQQMQGPNVTPQQQMGGQQAQGFMGSSNPVQQQPLPGPLGHQQQPQSLINVMGGGQQMQPNMPNQGMGGPLQNLMGMGLMRQPQGPISFGNDPQTPVLQGSGQPPVSPQRQPPQIFGGGGAMGGDKKNMWEE